MLKFCPEKTSLICFGDLHIPVLTLDGKTVKETSDIKYLGIIFDRTLSFQLHIDTKIKKAKALLFKLNSIVTSSFGPLQGS